MLFLNPFRHSTRVFRYSRTSVVDGLYLNVWHDGRCLSTTAVLNAKKVLKQFKLADIGEGITECEVIKWSVKPPSQIQAFDPLLEVQSDKASVEITSPFDGVVRELLVQEGEVAKVGSALCTIEVDEEVVEGLEAKGVVESLEQNSKSEERIMHKENDITGVNEQGNKSAYSEPPPRRPHPLDPNQPQPPPLQSRSDTEVLALPSTRHYARSQNVDLTLLAPGSGKGGRIEKSDVDRFLAQKQREEEGLYGSSSMMQVGEDVVVELGRTRYGMWKAMTKSLEIPHFGYSTSLDLTSFHSMLPLLNTHIPPYYQSSYLQPMNLPVNQAALYPLPPSPEVSEHAKYSKLTYLPFLLKTLSKSMMEWPIFRSSITPASSNSNSDLKPTLTIRPTPHISLALSTPTGLYTPTLTSTHTQSIYSIASQLKYLSHLGRQIPCALTPREMPKKGGTITVSNVGSIGKGEYAHPVLVPGGGVAIVALGRAKWVWDYDVGVEDIGDDGIRRGKIGEKRLVVGVSWSADHRVVEGAELAAFVETWRSWVENPQRLIADGI